MLNGFLLPSPPSTGFVPAGAFALRTRAAPRLADGGLTGDLPGTRTDAGGATMAISLRNRRAWCKMLTLSRVGGWFARAQLHHCFIGEGLDAYSRALIRSGFVGHCRRGLARPDVDDDVGLHVHCRDGAH